MPNTYYNSDDKQPAVGDIIEDMSMDSPCIVSRVFGWRFERIKIGPKAKKFQPVLSNWKKPASSFKFIQRQDDVEWPFKYVQMNPNITCPGDIFMDKDDHTVFYMSISPVDTKATSVSLVDLGSDSPAYGQIESSLTTVWFIGNQSAVPVPHYTKDAIEFLIGEGHYPEAGDIYSDKYNSCYQVVEMPSLTNQSVVLAAMQPKSYASKDHDWPMFMYKEQSAFDFFEKALYLGTPDETLHAPNIGDIYAWCEKASDCEDNQYMIITDIGDKYLAPTLLYLDDLWMGDKGDKNADYLGTKWDTLEEFVGHTMNKKSWKFIENQDKIVGGPETKLINKWHEAFSAYALPAVTKEDIKLGALLAYVPNSTTYHDCIVVTTGDQGFSVWWLAFEGEDSELQEGFKQTFKFDKHLPLFLYNGHQDDYKGIEIPMPKKTHSTESTHPTKPTVKVGQIIDYITKNEHVTTCLVTKTEAFTFEVVLIDQLDILESPITYSFDDYFKSGEWSFVQHQDDSSVVNVDFAQVEKDLLEEESTKSAYIFPKPDLKTGKVEGLNVNTGKVEGLIKHTTVTLNDIPTPIHKLTEGSILNYYPYKDMQLPKKQASSFWTLLVIEIGTEAFIKQFKVMVLDKGTAPHPPSTKESYWFLHETYLKGDQGSLKYVMHMNDTALLTDEEEGKYFDILEGVGVSDSEA